MIKVYNIKVGEKTYCVEVEAISEKEGTILSNKKVQEVTPVVSNNAPGAGEKVEAPMQGVVVGVEVSVGQKVKVGDTLVVIEAMKMENPIVAPIDGTVTSVSVAKGSKVDGGDVLVTIA